MVVVASGNREGGLRWFKEYDCSLPLLLDQDMQLYKHIGLQRLVSVAWDLKVFNGYADAVVGGRVDRLAWPGDDVTVIGGDFICDSEGTAVYVYRSKEQYDRPEVTNLLERLEQVSKAPKKI